jgi:hypothetical protein
MGVTTLCCLSWLATIFHCPNGMGRRNFQCSPHQRLAPLIAAESDWSHGFFPFWWRWLQHPEPRPPHTRFASLSPKPFYSSPCLVVYMYVGVLFQSARSSARSHMGAPNVDLLDYTYMSDSTRSAQSPANTLFHQRGRDMYKSGNNASNYELCRRLNITSPFSLFHVLSRLFRWNYAARRAGNNFQRVSCENWIIHFDAWRDFKDHKSFNWQCVGLQSAHASFNPFESVHFWLCVVEGEKRVSHSIYTMGLILTPTLALWIYIATTKQNQRLQRGLGLGFS